jgi:hypothetical protein
MRHRAASQLLSVQPTRRSSAHQARRSSPTRRVINTEVMLVYPSRSTGVKGQAEDGYPGHAGTRFFSDHGTAWMTPVCSSYVYAEMSNSHYCSLPSAAHPRLAPYRSNLKHGTAKCGPTPISAVSPEPPLVDPPRDKGTYSRRRPPDDGKKAIA